MAFLTTSTFSSGTVTVCLQEFRIVKGLFLKSVVLNQTGLGTRKGFEPESRFRVWAGVAERIKARALRQGCHLLQGSPWPLAGLRGFESPSRRLDFLDSENVQFSYRARKLIRDFSRLIKCPNWSFPRSFFLQIHFPSSTGLNIRPIPAFRGNSFRSQQEW